MTDLTRQESHIRAVVYESLLTARTMPDTGLAGASEEQASSRFLSLIAMPAPNAESVSNPGSDAERWQIHIASDQLTLDHKIALEKHLLGNLAKALPESVVSLYFKRLSPQAKAAPNLPRSLDSAPAPFGLKPNRKAIPGVRQVIVIASGKGGVGKSTLSCNLAVALGLRGHKVGLLDADVYGPSGPTMLGLKGPLPVGDDGKIQPLSAHGVKTVSFGFLSDAYHPVIWRGPMVGRAVHQLCFDVDWGELDYLLIDLPPGTGDVQLSLIESLPLHGALVVTTPQDVALIDAHKAVSMFEKLEVPVLGVIENMAMYVCPNCGHHDHVFGEGGVSEFTQERSLPLLASIALHPSIRMAGDSGQPISLQKHHPQGKVFSELARKLCEQA